MNDEYQTKDDKFMLYKIMVDNLKKYFLVILFEHIPRINNKAIDDMATIGSLSTLR